MVPNADERRVVDLGTVGDSDAIAADKIPWRPDAGPGVDVAIAAESRAKQPQQEDSPAMERAGCRPE
jgi:hypothetical protein